MEAPFLGGWVVCRIDLTACKVGFLGKLKQSSNANCDYAYGSQNLNGSAIQNLIDYRLRRASIEMQSSIRKALLPFSLRQVSFFTLVVIVDNPGIRLAQVAEVLGVERPKLVAIINELQKAELIRRDPDLKDRRAFALNPTDRGLVLYQNAMGAVKGHEERMTADLTEDEVLVLKRALHKIEMIGHSTDGLGP